MSDAHNYAVDCHGCVLWDPTPEDFELIRAESQEMAPDND
jgi:hypothetical protein